MHDNLPRSEYREDMRDMRVFIRSAVHEGLEPIAKEITALKVAVQIQNGRVSKLEQWRWALLGAGAVLFWLIEHFWVVVT